jgi:hypothetical protein
MQINSLFKINSNFIFKHDISSLISYHRERTCGWLAIRLAKSGIQNGERVKIESKMKILLESVFLTKYVYLAL